MSQQEENGSFKNPCGLYSELNRVFQDSKGEQGEKKSTQLRKEPLFVVSKI
jgi:hypothetical protein